MDTQITININHNSLDKLLSLLKNESTYKCSKEYDIWEIRTDTNGQLEHCLVVAKSNIHAVKLYFMNENTVKISYIIPNKIMNAYFGKNAKVRRNIIEIITGAIRQAILAGPQKKAFEELEQNIRQIIS
jgi:hypothetical protein